MTDVDWEFLAHSRGCLKYSAKTVLVTITGPLGPVQSGINQRQTDKDINFSSAAGNLLWSALIAAEKFSSVSDSKLRITTSYLKLMLAARNRPISVEEFIAFAKRDRFFWKPLNNYANRSYLGELCTGFFDTFGHLDYSPCSSADAWWLAVQRAKELPPFQGSALRIAAQKALWIHSAGAVVQWQPPQIRTVGIIAGEGSAAVDPLVKREKVAAFLTTADRYLARLMPAVNLSQMLLSHLLGKGDLLPSDRVIFDRFLWFSGIELESRRRRVVDDLVRLPEVKAWWAFNYDEMASLVRDLGLDVVPSRET